MAGIKSDRWIRKMALEHGMIEPFEDRQVRQGVVSYGVSSYGYDCRVGNEFKVFTNVYNTVVDPKNFDPKSFVDIKGDQCIVPPNSFALASTIEYFRIPRDVLTVCLGKSTYARCGIIVNVTPFEPEWEGHVTIEISNTTPLPAKIYANEGIAQVLFGMAAVLLNGVHVEHDCIIAAGTLLTEGTRIPARSLVMGRPGKVKRSLTDEEVAEIRWYSDNYVNYRLDYSRDPGAGSGEP